MKKMLLLGSLVDKQTAWYIAHSFKELDFRVDMVDVRQIIGELGIPEGQPQILNELAGF